MKRIFFLTIMTFVFSTLSAQVAFEDGTLDELLEKSQREGKKLLVNCYTTWCEPCRILDKYIFSDELVGAFLNSVFVSTRLNMDKKEGLFVRKRYNVVVYPTVLVLNSDGTEFARAVGAIKSPKEFVGAIEKLLNSNLSRSKEKFKTSLDGANEYIQMLNDNYLIEERDKALASVYSRRKAADNYRLTNFALYNSMTSSIYHPVVLSILSDDNNAIKYLGRKVYAKFIHDKVNSTLSYMVMKNSICADKINELTILSKKHKEIKTPLLAYFQKISRYIDDRNVDEIIAYSTKRFSYLSIEDRADMTRFVHRIAVNNNKIERLIPFYKHCVAESSDAAELSLYQESLKLVVNILTR